MAADEISADPNTWTPALEERVFQKGNRVVVRRVGRDTLLVPVQGELASLRRIYSLNAIGALIWDTLDGRVTLGEIVSKIKAEFDVDTETARRDLLEFLADLELNGLVKPARSDR